MLVSKELACVNSLVFEDNRFLSVVKLFKVASKWSSTYQITIFWQQSFDLMNYTIGLSFLILGKVIILTLHFNVRNLKNYCSKIL